MNEQRETLNPYEGGNNPQENTESEDSSQVVDAGVPGQIQYPDREVYAEQAAGYAAGKKDTLYPEGDPRNEGWANPAEREAAPGDETGEETEPAAFTGEDPNREEDR